MKYEQILKKAIEKAEKNGYKGHIDYLPAFHKIDKRKIDVLLFSIKEKLIFSHDFAKAFWEECKHKGAELETELQIQDWQIHLQQMVLEKEPLKYLERFLSEK